MIRSAAPILTLLGVLSAACTPARLPLVSQPAVPAAPPDAVLYLIGDAGLATDSMLLLRQLREDVQGQAATSAAMVVFLGDNVYEHGVRPEGAEGRSEDVARLAAQAAVVQGTPAQAVFIPGNHDWDQSGGTAAIQRQADLLQVLSSPGLRARMLPADACPGPVSVELAASLQLIFLDTEWWLRDAPEEPNPSCPNASRQGVLDSLGATLQSAGPGHVILVGHHPLETYGRHGGYYGIRDVLFPATNLWKPLYLPIPFLYPIVRNLIASRQNLINGSNRELREGLARIFRQSGRQPLAYAAGHEHGLQVFEGSPYSVGTVLVSGAGSKLTPVGKGSALFAAGEQHGELGYMRISVWRDGRALLSVYTDGTRACRKSGAACAPEAALRFTRWLAE
ncbi:MAG: metallophosphoesterase [Gemmatimonadota bacterium]